MGDRIREWFHSKGPDLTWEHGIIRCPVHFVYAPVVGLTEVKYTLGIIIIGIQALGHLYAQRIA